MNNRIRYSRFQFPELINILVNYITLSSVFGSVTFVFTTRPKFRVNPLLGLYICLRLTVHVFMVIILHYVILCYVMLLCYIKLYYIMLCYVMLYYIILYIHTNFNQNLRY